MFFESVNWTVPYLHVWGCYLAESRIILDNTEELQKLLIPSFDIQQGLWQNHVPRVVFPSSEALSDALYRRDRFKNKWRVSCVIVSALGGDPLAQPHPSKASEFFHALGQSQSLDLSDVTASWPQEQLDTANQICPVRNQSPNHFSRACDDFSFGLQQPKSTQGRSFKKVLHSKSHLNGLSGYRRHKIPSLK